MLKLSFKLKYITIEYNDPQGYIIANQYKFDEMITEIDGFVRFETVNKIKFLYSDTPYEYMRQIQDIARTIGFEPASHDR